MARNVVRIAIAIVACASMAACGSSEEKANDPGAGADASDPQAMQLRFAQCMRDNGVDVPDPKAPSGDDGGEVILGPGNGEGVDPKVFLAAQKACAKYLDGLGGTGGPGTLTDADKQRMLDVAKCFREHGVEMPDPNFDSGAQVEIPLGDPGDPAFAEAREACGSLFGPAGAP